MLRGNVVRAAAFLGAVSRFLWRQLKHTTIGWRNWWFVFLPGEFLNVAMGLATWYFLAVHLSGGEAEKAIAYIVLGVSANSLLRSAVTHLYWAVHGLYSGYLESGGFRMRYWEYYSLAGIPKYVAITGFMLFDTLRSLSTMLLYLLVGVAAFGLSFGNPLQLLVAAGVLALGYLATLTVGVLVATSFWLFIRYRELTLNPFVWAIETLSPVVCGIYYPRDVLPRYLRALGDVLPQTYAIDALRVALGLTSGDMAVDIAVLALYAALLPLAAKVFRAGERWAMRKSGVL